MKILLTGATGYIGQRLLPLLAAAGHDVVCLLRDPRRFSLYAEMKLPGEAWLQFRIVDVPAGGHALEQLAAYRPRGLFGRLYWYLVLPFHGIIFKGMAQNIVEYGQQGLAVRTRPKGNGRRFLSGNRKPEFLDIASLIVKALVSAVVLAGSPITTKVGLQSR